MDVIPYNEDKIIGYMAVMISIAIEKIKMRQNDEIALEALIKAQTAYFSSLSLPTDKRL